MANQRISIMTDWKNSGANFSLEHVTAQRWKAKPKLAPKIYSRTHKIFWGFSPDAFGVSARPSAFLLWANLHAAIERDRREEGLSLLHLILVQLARVRARDAFDRMHTHTLIPIGEKWSDISRRGGIADNGREAATHSLGGTGSISTARPHRPSRFDPEPSSPPSQWA